MPRLAIKTVPKLRTFCYCFLLWLNYNYILVIVSVFYSNDGIVSFGTASPTQVPEEMPLLDDDYEHDHESDVSNYIIMYTCNIGDISTCSTMRGRIKGTDSTINAILRTVGKLLNGHVRAGQLSQEVPNLLGATSQVVVRVFAGPSMCVCLTVC